MAMNISKVLIEPVITEASTLNTEKNNFYTFKVYKQSTKRDIARAISELYKVEVVGVRTRNQKRKSRRVGRSQGFKPAWKKAYVAIKAGQRIDLTKGV